MSIDMVMISLDVLLEQLIHLGVCESGAELGDPTLKLAEVDHSYENVCVSDQ